jgi:hypothetical protein
MTFVVNRVMGLNVEGLTGAAYGGRSAERTNQRDGRGTRRSARCPLPFRSSGRAAISSFPRPAADKALIADPSMRCTAPPCVGLLRLPPGALAPSDYALPVTIN